MCQMLCHQSMIVIVSTVYVIFLLLFSMLDEHAAMCVVDNGYEEDVTFSNIKLIIGAVGKNKMSAAT